MAVNGSSQQGPNDSVRCWKDYSTYPENLTDTQEFQHDLKAYREMLDHDEKKLCHKTARNLRIMDLEEVNIREIPLLS